MNLADLDAIYFHTDYDGVVSAAILVRLGANHAQRRGVDYDMKARWAEEPIARRSAIVDFLYHPNACVWFDHHVDPFVRSEWRSLYHADPFHLWDPTAPACPPVIASALNMAPGEREHFADYLHWSSVIDAARYASASQAHDLSIPHILLSRVVALVHEPDMLATLVGLVATRSVHQTLQARDVRPYAEAALESEQVLKAQLKPLISFDGRVAFLDQSQVSGVYQRYLPYVYHPGAAFVIGIYRKGEQFNVSVGANPWRLAPHPHLGFLCQKWGGGGHTDVGGVTLTEYAEALRVAVAIHAELLSSSS